MDAVRVIRTVRFRARHHYRNPVWSDEENVRVFGEQTHPHEHHWMVEVHVVGPVAEDTGWAVNLVALDGLLADVTKGWSGGDLNVLVPEVAGGEILPSTECLARWLFRTLGPRVPPPAKLERVRVVESSELAAEYPAAGP